MKKLKLREMTGCLQNNGHNSNCTHGHLPAETGWEQPGVGEETADSTVEAGRKNTEEVGGISSRSRPAVELASW